MKPMADPIDKFTDDLKSVVVFRVKARIDAHLYKHGELDGDVLSEIIKEEADYVFNSAKDFLDEVIEEVRRGT